jgi:hypothetical protein
MTTRPQIEVGLCGETYFNDERGAGRVIVFDESLVAPIKGVIDTESIPLLAAAPDLLAVCKAWMDCDNACDLKHIIRDAKTAIAKAEGIV